MTATAGDQRSCAVQLCPALAHDGSAFCVAHRTAKKLAQIDVGEKCRSCDRVLHVGDYVTLLSTARQNHHALCPESKPRGAGRGPHDTPLFDQAPETTDSSSAAEK